MKRPSFQFYPGDWTGNSNLRRCTHAEKGVWLEVLCLMHDQAEYGVLRWPLKEIAEAVKCKPADIRALVNKGVLKGGDDQLADPFVYVPRSGRKDGEPVTLIAPQKGPIWYSSRMVKDEHVRTIRGEGTRFGEPDGASPKVARNSSPKGGFGDGPSSSPSSSASLFQDPNGSSSTARLPTCPHLVLLQVFGEVLPTLPQPRAELWTGASADAMRARWKWLLTATRSSGARYATDEASGIDFFRRFFTHVGDSDFLMGRTGDFKCTLQWLMKAENFAKVVQGNYANKEHA